MLEMDQWLVWDSFFFLSRIFFLWIINIFLSAQVTESRRSISRTDGDLEIWTWEYAEARWDRVHSMWGKNWNIPQKNRLARCSKNTFSFLPGHIITSFFHLPLGSGMDWALASGIMTERCTKHDLGISFLHDLPFSLFLALLERCYCQW